jgi:hypothetical protein
MMAQSMALTLACRALQSLAPQGGEEGGHMRVALLSLHLCTVQRVVVSSAQDFFLACSLQRPTTHFFFAFLKTPFAEQIKDPFCCNTALIHYQTQ